MLGLYDIIYAVESVDAWKPDVNLYESGEIVCNAPFCLPKELLCQYALSAVRKYKTNQTIPGEETA